MFLKIQKNINSDYNEAIKYFLTDYLITLKSKESIVSRFLISKEIEKKYKIKKYLPKIDFYWIPLFDNGIFWSVSHKDNLVFVWMNSEKIWVDIEIFKERDLSVLEQFRQQEYNLLWWKNWTNFYILWTAKESIIKYNLWKLDDIINIKLIKEKDIDKVIDGLIFIKELLFDYKTSQLQVFFWRKDDIFYSICINMW